MATKNRQRATRQNSGFQFAIADRIEFLNSADWDTVTSEASVFLSRRYLAAVQDEFGEQFIRRFGIVYDEGCAAAVVATQTFDVTADKLVGDSSDHKIKLPKEIRRRSLSLVKRRIMMCGNVHTWGPHGVAFAAGENPERLWPGVADCLYRIRRADRLNGQTDYVIVKDLFEDQNKSASALEPFRYQQLETEPNMVLTIGRDWTTFDDYLGSLTSKYRKAAKKVLKPFNTDACEVEQITDIAGESARIHELYKSVASKADVRLFELTESTLPRLAGALGEDFTATGIRKDGKLIGFVTVVRDAETAIGYYVGVDYEANARLPLYHRLLFAVIEQAIAWKCRQVSFGRTALDAKSRLGCHPEETAVWVRHRIPLLNFFVQQLLKNVTHDEPPERNPFKDDVL